MLEESIRMLDSILGFGRPVSKGKQKNEREKRKSDTAAQLIKINTGIYEEDDEEYIYSSGAHLSDHAL